jgi:hypothetical protein
MKKLILLMIAIILQKSSVYCQLDSSVAKTNKQFESNAYLLKAKKQKTAAWVCLGGGYALVATGLILANSKNSEDQLNNLTLYSGEYLPMMVTGATAMLASISLFNSAKKIKHNATLKVAFQKGAEGLPVALSKKITGLTLSIPM